MKSFSKYVYFEEKCLIFEHIFHEIQIIFSNKVSVIIRNTLFSQFNCFLTWKIINDLLFANGVGVFDLCKYLSCSDLGGGFIGQNAFGIDVDN